MFASQGFGSQGTTLGFGASQGGGFFSAGDRGSTMLASPQSKRVARQDDKQTCLPLTIRMLMNAFAQEKDGSGELTVHGTQPTHVVLVGVVEKLNQQAASFEFIMNDSTGRLAIRHFTSGGKFDKIEAIEDGQYVSIVGSIRTSPNLHVSAMNVRVVGSPDLISYHMIESAYACLKLQRKGTDAPVADTATPLRNVQASPMRTIEASPPVSLAASPPPALTPQPFSSPPKEFAPPPAMFSAAASSPGNAVDLSNMVLQILQQQAETCGERGVPFELICKHLGPGVAMDRVKAELERFIEEGEAYNTIDESHYAVV